MSRTEKRCLALALLLLSVLFYRASMVNYYLLQLDTAYFVESIDTTRERWVPSTMLTRSVIHAIQNTISVPAEAVCKYPFESDGTAYIPIHERHLFPIFYPLAVASLVLPSLAVFGLCTVIAFPGLLAAAYIIARRWAVPAGGAVILVALIAAHPTWSYASFGQFYPDKLFPPLAIVYFMALHEWMARDNRRMALLVISGILAISTSERSAIMLAAGSFGVILLFGGRRRRQRSDLTPVAMAVGAACYAVLYMKLVQTNSDYSSFPVAGRALLRALTQDPGSGWPVYKFLFINILFLAPFAVFARRWSLIALGAMIPNLVGSIGGAEKLGWSTHYHSTYFPFLIMAALAGSARIAQMGPNVRRSMSAVGVATAGLLFYLDPFVPRPLVTASPLQPGLIRMLALQVDKGEGVSLRDSAEFMRKVAEAIPAGSEVSTTESFMPALYSRGVRLIHFYPLGLRAAEYVVLPYIGEPGALSYSGHVSYLGDEVRKAADQCLIQIVMQHYVVASRVQITPNQGADVFRLRSMARPAAE